MRTGIFGGSFNPIHNGHIELVKAAIRDANLDRVFVIPTALTHYKSNVELLPAKDRLKLCSFAFESISEVSILDIEVTKGKSSYTADTIRYLKSQYPDDKFIYLCGQDVAKGIGKWREGEFILANVEIYETDRHIIDISSSEIRDLIVNNKPYNMYMPEKCSNYLKKIHAYESDIDLLPFKENNLAKYFEEEMFGNYINKLKSSLSRSRYIHSLGVAFEASKLAKKWNSNIDKCFLSGLLHDCGKELDKSKNGLMHAEIGKKLAQTEYGIEDKDILRAIKNHINGVPEMDLISQIIFIADYIEPSRDKAPNLDTLRELAYKDINLATVKICEGIIAYLSSLGTAIDDSIYSTYNYYKEYVKNN